MNLPLTPLKGYDLREHATESSVASIDDVFYGSLDFASHLLLTTFSNEHIEIAAATVPNPKLSDGNPEYVDSGDYYGILSFSPNRTGLVIADSNLSGKQGLEHSTKICSQLRNFLCRESRSSPTGRSYMPPRDAMERLAKKNVAEGMEFCSLLYVDVMITKTGKGALSIYSAGHNFPILYSPIHGIDKKEYEYPKTNGVAIGLDLENPKYPAHTFIIERGDYIVLFTDGVTESRMGEKDDLERTGLVGFLDEAIKSGFTEPKKLVNLFLSTLNAFNNPEHHADDMTLMVARIK